MFRVPTLELKNYLLRFPGEVSALALLSAQMLEEPDTLHLRSNMRGHITTSALVLDHTCTNVLLIDHRFLKEWLQPGGHYEDGPDNPAVLSSLAYPRVLYLSALREVEEETGVVGASPINFPPFGNYDIPVEQTEDILGDCLLDIDTHEIPANPAKGEGTHFHHDFVYLVRAPKDNILLPQLEEVNGLKWQPLNEFRQSPRARFQRIADKLSVYFGLNG